MFTSPTSNWTTFQSQNKLYRESNGLIVSGALKLIDEVRNISLGALDGLEIGYDDNRDSKTYGIFKTVLVATYYE